MSNPIARAYLTLKPPHRARLETSTSTLELTLGPDCTMEDPGPLLGHLAGIALLAHLELLGRDDAQRVVEDLAKYTQPGPWGRCITPPTYPLDLSHHILEAIAQVEQAARRLTSLWPRLEEWGLVPQVGINIIQAPPPPYHVELGNHVGIPSRIAPSSRGPLYAAPPRPGGSRHLARALRAYMEYYPDTRAVMNLALSRRFLEEARMRGYRASSYNRDEEPEEVRRREGATMPWGIRTAIEKCVEKPHIIFHRGDVGKEPMINLFAPTAPALIDMLRNILGYDTRA